jgi:hypothetical protein
MNIFMVTPPYIASMECNIVDGLLDLGHEVYSDKAINYMEQMDWDKRDGVDLFIMADTHNHTGLITRWTHPDKEVYKVIIHTHDMWSDYPNIPDCPRAKIDPTKWVCDIAFIRDLEKGVADMDLPFPVYPLDYSIERRYVESCQPKSYRNRSIDVGFWGSLETARRGYFLDKIRQAFPSKSIVYGGYDFNEPDGKWSKHIYGRYTHDNKYYETISDCKFIYAPLGGGPSTMRLGEVYAAGAIPLIQRYPEDIILMYKFEDGRNCVLWSTENELIEKVKYYLDKPEEAEALAIRCSEYARDYMLSKHVAQYILNKCEEWALL